MKVKIKKLENFKGDLPKYETPHASGMDVRAQLKDPLTLHPGKRAMIPTGLSFEIPPGWEIQVRARSGWAARNGIGLPNGPGTIDADYRGELKVILINWGEQSLVINDQDRVAQLVLCPVQTVEWQEVQELSDSSRGEGGFGSTGRS